MNRAPIDLLLANLHRLSGFDFSAYNRKHILRRLELRMKLENCADLSQLLGLLLQSPALLNNILEDFSIQVTSLFRDAEFFQEFRNKIVPILRELPEIYIWHAGCSTGEEAYSMAILLTEEGLLEKTHIYATDFNEKAVEQARRGAFPLQHLTDYAENYRLAGGKETLSAYMDTDGESAYFHSALSQAIFFEQHNLVTDGSFHEFHVILCRNVCIYFNTSLQKHVQELFYNSLYPGGLLCLGDQESLISLESNQHFKEFGVTNNIYSKLEHPKRE
ncbi:CheR family methyltransferase [Paenibacillus donghaensis]|nr:protein-glutamate O-methyltransferase CheR [Paenibacillus donghaensis]